MHKITPYLRKLSSIRQIKCLNSYRALHNDVNPTR
ncbi:FLZ-type domain-containing protein [Psidium guajava]|nr:FLZ-type domain-containing protein [Psidium guajava]